MYSLYDIGSGESIYYAFACRDIRQPVPRCVAGRLPNRILYVISPDSILIEETPELNGAFKAAIFSIELP